MTEMNIKIMLNLIANPGQVYRLVFFDIILSVLFYLFYYVMDTRSKIRIISVLEAPKKNGSKQQPLNFIE